MEELARQLNEELSILIGKMRLIDTSLIDNKDDSLVTISGVAGALYGAAMLDGDIICGLIGRSYAAGRARGRRESAMREVLTMEVRDGG